MRKKTIKRRCRRCGKKFVYHFKSKIKTICFSCYLKMNDPELFNKFEKRNE